MYPVIQAGPKGWCCHLSLPSNDQFIWSRRNFLYCFANFLIFWILFLQWTICTFIICVNACTVSRFPPLNLCLIKFEHPKLNSWIRPSYTSDAGQHEHAPPRPSSMLADAGQNAPAKGSCLSHRGKCCFWFCWLHFLTREGTWRS
jgi:hypothetical protein